MLFFADTKLRGCGDQALFIETKQIVPIFCNPSKSSRVLPTWVDGFEQAKVPAKTIVHHGGRHPQEGRLMGLLTLSDSS